jgi:hypothetical protein
MRRSIALLLLVCACGIAPKASAAVLITADDTYANVNDASSSNTDQQSNTGGTTAIATLPGYSSSVISIFNPSNLSATVAQSRAGNYGGIAYGQVLGYFTTDSNVPYTAAGTFSNSDGATKLLAKLRDTTTNYILFESVQQSVGGPAVFNLGGLTGNDYNVFSGSLSGILLANHSYEWLSYAYTYAFPGPDNGATASGNVSLSIGAVPEFSSVIVWSLLALTIGGTGWWKRRLPGV